MLENFTQHDSVMTFRGNYNKQKLPYGTCKYVVNMLWILGNTMLCFMMHEIKELFKMYVDGSS